MSSIVFSDLQFTPEQLEIFESEFGDHISELYLPGMPCRKISVQDLHNIGRGFNALGFIRQKDCKDVAEAIGVPENEVTLFMLGKVGDQGITITQFLQWAEILGIKRSVLFEESRQMCLDELKFLENLAVILEKVFSKVDQQD